MVFLSRLNQIMDTVGRRDGIHGLQLGADGTCAMTLRNGACVVFEAFPEDGRLCLYAPLRKLPEAPEERLRCLTAMTDRNFVLSADACLARACHRDEAVYRIMLDIQALDADRLDAAIDRLLHERERELSLLESALQGNPRESASSPRVRRSTNHPRHLYKRHS